MEILEPSLRLVWVNILYPPPPFSYPACHNPNVEFTNKCELQGHIRPEECV
jgi:hypothetical protein